eukprot:5974977-Prymnesium_polylepis.1
MEDSKLWCDRCTVRRHRSARGLAGTRHVTKRRGVWTLGHDRHKLHIKHLFAQQLSGGEPDSTTGADSDIA